MKLFFPQIDVNANKMYYNRANRIWRKDISKDAEEEFVVKSSEIKDFTLDNTRRQLYWVGYLFTDIGWWCLYLSRVLLCLSTAAGVP